MSHRTFPQRVRATCLLVLAVLPSWSCAGGNSVAKSLEKTDTQSRNDVDEILKNLKPTEKFVANADSQMLWQAASGYMERAFPLDTLPPEATSGANGSRQIRSQLVQWVGDGLPHRTRVFVEVRNDPANAANMRLRVSALLIESEPRFEQAKPNAPLEYDWRLTGSNTRVEETIVDQIMKRYLALREGKPLPLDEELVLPRRPEGG
jgi:hypothetical protein